MNHQMLEIRLDESRKALGREVKDRREFLQMSVEELADKAGVASYTVARFEDGKFWIGMKQYLQILNVLGLRGFTVNWGDF